jgi:DNA modification methylase
MIAEVRHCDAFLEVPKIESSFDLIVSSPPYNIGKEYESRELFQDYLENQRQLLFRLVQLLSDTGSLCWQVGNYINKGEVFPLDIYYYQMFKDLDLKLRNRIIWRFGHGLHASNRFSGRYETVLWFTKSDNYIFNLDDVRIPSKYPGKRHFKGPKKGQLSGNPKGKNPSDIWDILLDDWEKEVWEIPNVKANHPEKTEHPCQYPVELIERFILALTNEGDLVLDPFGGVGATAIAAVKNRRNAIILEKEENYCQIARDRLTALEAGTLKTRPINKRIHEPSVNEKAAQVPDEWK